MKYIPLGMTALLAAVLVALPTAHADNCRPVRVTSYVQPKPVVFVAEPVAVPPLFPYPVLFQFIAPPTTPPPAVIAGSLFPAPAAQAPSEVEQRLARIEAALLKMAGPARAAVALPPVAYAEGEPLPARSGSAANDSGHAANAQRTASSNAYVPQVAALLQQKCAQCHSEPGRGNVHLFDLAGTFNPNVSADDIWRSVARDRMPRTPEKLDPQSKALLKAWADAEERRVGR